MIIVHYATSAMKRFLTSVNLQHEPKASDVITLVYKTFFRTSIVRNFISRGVEMRISAREACVKPHLRTRRDIKEFAYTKPYLQSLYIKIHHIGHTLLKSYTVKGSAWKLQYRYLLEVFMHKSHSSLNRPSRDHHYFGFYFIITYGVCKKRKYCFFT